MENFKQKAIDTLKNLENDRAAFAALSEKLAALDDRMTSPRTASCSAAPIHGGGNRFEETIVSAIKEKDELTHNAHRIKSHIESVDNALKLMRPNEREALYKFYVHRTDEYIAELKKDLRYEKSELYRIKTRALNTFIYFFYGVKLWE